MAPFTSLAASGMATVANLMAIGLPLINETARIRNVGSFCAALPANTAWVRYFTRLRIYEIATGRVQP